MAEHSCGIKGCALFEVSLLALVSGKFSSPSCTAPVIMLCVSMLLACLYQLSGWFSLSCAPKEEPPKLSGFIIPEITEDLNLDDCGHKIKDLEAISFLSKVLQFQAVLQAVTPLVSPLLHVQLTPGTQSLPHKLPNNCGQGTRQITYHLFCNTVSLDVKKGSIFY